MSPSNSRAFLLSGAMLALAYVVAYPAVADVTPTGDTMIGNNIALVGDIGFGALEITAPEEFLTGETTIGNQITGVGNTTITGAGANWENAGPFIVGNEGAGRLDILDDATLTNDGLFQIAVGNSSQGVVNVAGDNTRLAIATRLEVALLGHGQLNVSGGAEVSAQDLFVGRENFQNNINQGVVRLTGPETRMNVNVNLQVGVNGGAGELWVSQGAVLRSGDFNQAAIGQQGGQGLATIQDPGSRWDHGGTIFVGRLSANGELRILEGGVVTTDEAIVGTTQGQFQNAPHGEVLIDGVGSLWEVGRDFAVGELQDFGPQNGNGRVTIRNGAHLRTGFGEQNSEATLGGGQGALGEMTVSGLGSRWDSVAELRLGRSGAGSLTVNAGAIVTTTESATLGADEGHGALTIDGPGSRVDIGRELTVGETGSGEVHIRSGGVLRALLGVADNRAVTIGGDIDSYGRMVVDGVGSRLATSGPQFRGLVVGDRGRGELEITGGAAVDIGSVTLGAMIEGNGPSRGSLLIAGPGSRLTARDGLTVGALGVGELTVRDGGLFSTGGANFSPRVYLGEFTGSHGSVLVDGEGSEWIHAGDFVSIGPKGAGELAIRSGAEVQMGRVELGNATVEVTGPGAFWEVATMQVNPNPGYSTSLTIAAGGEVRITDGDLDLSDDDQLILAGGALTSPNPASVLVRNGGLIRGDGLIGGHLINTGDVRIGPGEKLTVARSTQTILTNQGRIEVLGTAAPDGKAELMAEGASRTDPGGQIFAGDARLRFQSNFLQPEFVNRGELTFAFGTSEVFGDVVNVRSDGVVTVAGDSRVTFFDDVNNQGTLNVAAGSRAIVFGAFSGNGNIGGGDVELFGQVAPGASPGVMQFGGDLTLGVLSELQIELAGAGPNEFDQLDITGAAELSGALEVNLLGDYVPTLGDAFEILTATSVSGQFTLASLPNLGPLSLEVVYDPTSVTLAVVPTLPGDYNADGLVDAIDYALWRESVGMTGAGLAADGDRSGVVDAGDFDVWRDNYGATLAASIPSPAPEPAALLLTLFAAILTAPRSHRE